jgi:ubiquitin-like modifier-activating enzyme ATG7
MPPTTLKFEPWQSAVDPSFWSELARRKLETVGLSEAPATVDALYAPASNAVVSSPAQLDRYAFRDDGGGSDGGGSSRASRPDASSSASASASASARDALSSGRFRMPGTLVNVNTLERFRAFDRAAFLASAADALWAAILGGDAERDPSLLTPFLLLAHADLKSWRFAYWFAFPALKLAAPIEALAPPRTLADFAGEDAGAEIADACERWLREGGACAWVVVEDADAETIPTTEGDGKKTRRRRKCVSLGEFRAAREKGAALAPPTAAHHASDPPFMLAFADPCSNPAHPGWALRNLLAMVATTWRPCPDEIDVVCCRKTRGACAADASVVLRVGLGRSAEALKKAAEEETADATSSKTRGGGTYSLGAVGWELNANGRAGARVANLRSSMDPARLAAQATDLNLKLMRWRLFPELDADKLRATSCLLLGAGTLGCAVARCLLGWGVRKISFVDNGLVSYSNPARQSLFEHADCADGGRPKAQCAAEALRRIFPGVEAEGVRLSIPMPGHVVSGEREKERVLADVDALEAMVDAHDVVFLLTDTRESRWLPTVLCAAAKGEKLLINAALGFDTYLVMRHGGAAVEEEEVTEEEEEEEEEREGEDRARGKETTTRGEKGRGKGGVASGRLGCYFCNDVMAPGNSTADRTLDQQCTVTRPGLAPVAGALAVEMMVALKHAPEGARTPPPPPPTPTTGSATVGSNADAGGSNTDQMSGVCAPARAHRTPLGVVPHQIRGSVHEHAQTLFAAPAFPRCVGCSPAVTSRFRADKAGFCLSAFNDPTFLEDATGLTAVHEAADAAEWIGGESDEDDF